MEKRLPKAMEKLIAEVRETLGEEKKLADMFETCFTNTLDTTVKKLEDGTAYVITGDIPAMWLRDSVCQLRPYLILAKEEEEIGDLLEGLAKRLCCCIKSDPYANAFNETENGNCWEKDETDMGEDVWERKYEVDSLCFPVQFCYLLWKNTGRTSHMGEEFKEAVRIILDVFKTEQNHEENSPYRFVRRNTYFTDTLSREGKGSLVKKNIGMTWSGFRPSDDACVYGYLVPSNMFAVVVLEYIGEIAETVLKDPELKREALDFAAEIREAVEHYAVLEQEQFGKVYAYEVDGFGQYLLMDDANVPSLLSIPYLGYTSFDQEIYQNTRRMILSEKNPYFYKGEAAQGIGSPHTPINYIWHISLAMQGLTAEDREEKKRILKLLAATDGDTGRMHEGFHADDPKQFTREWFSWANAVFCELVLDYCGYSVKRS